VVTRQAGAFLRAHRKVCLDTSVFIYFIERHPSYSDICASIFRNIEEDRIEATTSTLTLTEILVQPYKLKKDDLVYKFYSLFTTYPHLKWTPLTLDISDLAARLRAEYNLKTPDAIQMASALSTGSTGFICNDRAFRRVKNIECLILSDSRSALNLV
jgi:predicted nucleic acid-binding protein